MVTISQALLKEDVEQDGTSESFSLSLHSEEFERISFLHEEFTMPSGMIGFEGVTRYSIEALEGNIIYKMMGNPENTPIFYLINPYTVVPSYTLSLRDEEHELLGSPDFGNIIVFSTLTFSDNIEQTTCNLLGPLVINNNAGLMLQVVNDASTWGTKHLISTGEKVVQVRIIDNEND